MYEKMNFRADQEVFNIDIKIQKSGKFGSITKAPIDTWNKSPVLWNSEFFTVISLLNPRGTYFLSNIIDGA